MKYSVKIVDHNAPWDLTRRQIKEIAEIIPIEASSREDAIEIAEDYALEALHEWARVWLLSSGRAVWNNYQ